MIRRNLLISIFYVFILALFFAEFFYAPSVLSKLYLSRILLFDLVSLIIFLFRHENIDSLKNQYFKISILFLIGFCLVQFQIYIDYILGNYGDLGHDYFIDETIVPKAIVGSSIALVSFLLGYVIYSKKDIWFKSKFYAYRLFPVKVLLFISYTFFCLFLLVTDTSYYSGKYGIIELSSASVYFQNYLIYSIFGVIILKVWNLGIKNYTNISFSFYVKTIGFPLLILIFVYLSLVILSGDRGPIIQISLVFLSGYFILSRKKFSVFYFIFLLVVSMTFLSFLGVLRALSDTDDWAIKASSVSQARSNLSSSNSFSPNTMELATVVRTYHAAIVYTDNHGYSLGMFQAYHIIGVIPGFGTIFNQLWNLDSQELRSSHLLTAELGADHGMGTTSVADIYLDFGVVGVGISFLLFGLFVRILDRYSYSQGNKSLFFLVVIMVFFAFSIYIGRSSILSVFRHVFLTFILIHISFIISKIILNKT